MIDFSITTPARTLVNEPVESVTLPTQLGQITVLSNHIPLIANLVPGEVIYKGKDGEKFFAVSGGFIEVKEHSKVVVLADSAEFGHEIDVDRAEKARAEAVKLMEDNRHDETAFADAAAALEKSMARLRVARKHRTHTSTNLESGNFKG